MHEPPALPKAWLVLGPILLQTRGPLPTKLPWTLPSANTWPQPATGPAVPTQVTGSKLGSAHSDDGPFVTTLTGPPGVDMLDMLPQTGPQRFRGTIGTPPMFSS